MNLNEYQQLALKTAITADVETDINHFGFGLMAEAGEVANIFQKYYRGDTRYHNAEWWDTFDAPDWGSFTPEALEMVERELGDVLWHIAVLADTFGLTLENVAKTNVKKLSKRALEGTLKGDGDDR